MIGFDHFLAKSKCVLEKEKISIDARWMMTVQIQYLYKNLRESFKLMTIFIEFLLSYSMVDVT